jgi:hypothetical protein
MVSNTNQQLRPASNATQALSRNSGRLQPLPASLKGAAVLPALERLCSAKKTVELTDHQTETWLASLSVFDHKIVNEAVIRLAHSEDPFPDLGKLVKFCEALRRERSGTPSQGDVKLGKGTMLALAEAWGLEVER